MRHGRTWNPRGIPEGGLKPCLEPLVISLPGSSDPASLATSGSLLTVTALVRGADGEHALSGTGWVGWVRGTYRVGTGWGGYGWVQGRVGTWAPPGPPASLAGWLAERSLYPLAGWLAG